MSIPVVRFLGTLARIRQRHHFQESNLLQKQAASGKLPCARQRAAPTCSQAPAGQSPWCYPGAAAPVGTADKGFWGSAPELGFSSVYVIRAPSRLIGAGCGDCAKPSEQPPTDPTRKSHPKIPSTQGPFPLCSPPAPAGTCCSHFTIPDVPGAGKGP